MATSEWKSLEAVQNLLHPFALFTSLVQGEGFTTTSAVIPAIMDLNLHLEELTQHVEVGVAAKVLQTELKKDSESLQIQVTPFTNIFFVGNFT